MNAPILRLIGRICELSDVEQAGLRIALAQRAQLREQAPEQELPTPAWASLTWRTKVAWAWARLAQDKPALAVFGPLALLLLPAALALIAIQGGA